MKATVVDAFEIPRTVPKIFTRWEPGLTAARELRRWMERQQLPLDPEAPNIEQLARIEAALAVDNRRIPRSVRRFIQTATRGWKIVLSQRSERSESAWVARQSELSVIEGLAATYALRSLKLLPEWKRRSEAAGRVPDSWAAWLLAGLAKDVRRQVPRLRIGRLSEIQIRLIPSRGDSDDERVESEQRLEAIETGKAVMDWLTTQNDLTLQRVVRLVAGVGVRKPWTIRAIAKALDLKEDQVRELLLRCRTLASEALAGRS